MAFLNNRKSLRDFLIIFVTSCLIYFPLLGQKARNPDAQVALPSLFSVSSPLEYLNMLSEFRVVDFQPVRDLTFFFDIAIFKLTGIVTFPTTNVILWILAIFLFMKLLIRTSPEKESSAILWSLAFASYPLFSQVIPWGMARKHVLAFLLILWTTHAFLDWFEGKQKVFKSYLGYVLACLSHPITVFWPVWAAVHLALFSPEKLKAEKKSFYIFALTAMSLLFTNYAYYTVGNPEIFEVFSNVRPDFLDVPRVFINFTFYLRQMIFPYQLGFLYHPELKSSWPGILFLVTALGFLYHFRKDRVFVSWFLFSSIPFPVVLGLPGVFDQYLLIPTAGLVLLAFYKCGNFSRKVKVFVCVLITLWSAMSFYQARLWTDALAISGRNFKSMPSCKSATDLAFMGYSEGKKATPELLQFIKDGNCLNLPAHAPRKQHLAVQMVESIMLYYEEETFPYEYRLRRLLQLGTANYYPLILFATLKARENKPEEVKKVTEYILEKTGDNRLETEEISDQILRPYCLRHKLEACIKITVPYNPKPAYL